MIEFLLNVPLYFNSGIVGLWHLIYSLPWPSLNDIFGSFTIFLILWYPRYRLERFAKKQYRHDHKRQGAPTSKDHQAAASSIGNIFGHH
jgi:hypothetical protein